MNDFKLIFEAYGGDYTATMHRFMGNEKMYLKILNMLSQDENMQKLQASLQRKDWTAAFESAHTLKGVAGNLGLAPLSEAVSRIVEPLREGETQADYAALLSQIQMEYAKVEQLRQDLLLCSENSLR